MRWVSFGRPGGERPGVFVDDGTLLDVAAAWPHWPRSWRGLLAAGMLPEITRCLRSGAFSRRDTLPVAALRLGPPVPDACKIVALGRNYAAHAAEQNRPPPRAPLLFAKATSALVGHEATVIVPPQETQPDYEAEMALVIGRRARCVSAAEALDCVAGITILNDVSGRQAQFADRLWFRGKGFDTFAPAGPWVVSLDEVGDPDDLQLEMRVNGALRQHASTAEMIFGCREIVAYVSAQMTLEPGDLIATGTPAGVGVFRDPPRFLGDGDVMEVRLAGVGTLRNPVSRKG